jgi:hypothetical protein
MLRNRTSGWVLCKAIAIALCCAAAMAIGAVSWMRSQSQERASQFYPSATLGASERAWALGKLGAPTSEPLAADIAAVLNSHRQYLDARQLHNSEAYAAEHCTLTRFKVSYQHKMEKPSELPIEYIRIPSITGNRSGVVLLFHGCGHSARDFCAPSALCENCLGLAEELHYVHQALANGFEVLAVSSPNRGSHCWASSRIVRPDPEWMWNNRDVHAVLRVLAHENILGRTIPIIAVGASSGGSVLTTLPAILGAQLYAVVSQIAAPTFPIGLRPQVVVYDLMSRDSPLVERATKEQMSLTAGGVRCGVRIRKPAEIDEEIFSRRIPGFPVAASKDIVSALESDPEVVDPRTRLLAANPRTTRKRWTPLVRAVLQKHFEQATIPEARRLLSDSLTPDASVIAEQMNVLYAQHEFFADHAFGTLRFITLSPSVVG